MDNTFYSDSEGIIWIYTFLPLPGEKLSKQQLHNSNIIKKLRAKDKENENTITKLNKKVKELEEELQHLKQVAIIILYIYAFMLFWYQHFAMAYEALGMV